MKKFRATALIVGLAFTGFCGTTNETNGVDQAQPEHLFTRTFKIQTNTFWDNLKHLSGAKEYKSDDEMQLHFQMLRSFFEEHGVGMKPPTAMFLNHGHVEGQNGLYVRATLADLNKIEYLVLAVQNNVQPSEVH
jgi:hypothetical protein